jgi:nucleoside-diphosphate-sugar epimerase
VRQLLDSGDYDDVAVLDMQPCEVVGSRMIIGDLTNPSDLTNACKGIDVVFHVASAAPTTQNSDAAKQVMNIVNVFGTQNLLTACKEAGVGKVVYTSSASVVFNGSPLIDVTEECPYARTPMDFYTGTKIEVQACLLHPPMHAMQLVLVTFHSACYTVLLMILGRGAVSTPFFWDMQPTLGCAPGYTHAYCRAHGLMMCLLLS